MIFEKFQKISYVKLYDASGKFLFVLCQISFFGICISNFYRGHWSSGAIFLVINMQVFSWIWLYFFKYLAHLEQKNKDRI